MNRSDILDTAKAHVTQNRQATHGDAKTNFDTVAAYWGAHLNCKVDAVDVAVMMTLWKAARIKANPNHEDNWIDGAGYLALGGELSDPPPPAPPPELRQQLTPVQAFLMVLGSTSAQQREKLLHVKVRQDFLNMLCAMPITASLVAQDPTTAKITYDGIELLPATEAGAEAWDMVFAEDDQSEPEDPNYDPTGGSGVGD